MKKFIFFVTFISVLANCKNKPADYYSESGFKEINGTQLYYKVLGSGEPILIIHGGPGLSHDYLLPNLKSLSEKFKLIFYDQRASGSSAQDLDANSVTIDNFIKDIDALREAYDLKTLNIMAHSWGGILAMKYATMYPNNIKSLILVNSVGANSEIANLSNIELAKRFTDEDSLQRAQILKSEEFQKRSVGSIESLMKLGFKHQFYNKSYLDSLNLAINENFMTSSQLLQNLAKDLGDFDFDAELKSIQCPTLLIYGNYDPLTQLAGIKIHESIDNSELVILEKCGHFPFIEKEEEFRKVLVDFMDEHK
jgi:proline iminopeptidase